MTGDSRFAVLNSHSVANDFSNKFPFLRAWGNNDTIYCGAPRYADDLVLVTDSPEESQAMLNIAHIYTGKWQYNLNANKSF